MLRVTKSMAQAALEDYIINLYKILIERRKAEWPIRTPRHKWANNIKMEHIAVSCNVDRIRTILLSRRFVIDNDDDDDGCWHRPEDRSCRRFKWPCYLDYKWWIHLAQDRDQRTNVNENFGHMKRGIFWVQMSDYLILKKAIAAFLPLINYISGNLRNTTT